jgi:nudix-type nucleoside diphosphatase (YffH/AdpP family)
MERKTEVISRRVLLDDFFQVDEVQVAFEKFAGGMSQPVRRLTLERNDAVAALVVNKARGTVVLVRQFRFATLSRGGGWLTEVVAGLIDKGEAPEAAIKREILEEAGFETGKLELIVPFYSTPGITSERILLYCAETKGMEPLTNGGGVATEHEDILVLEMPYAAAFALMERGEITDGKTLIALLWLKDRLAQERAGEN